VRVAEAMTLVGKPVWVWTAMNGTYEGTLVGVLRLRPWRGRVHLERILSCPAPWEIGRLVQRKGLPLGQIKDFGGSSIKPIQGDPSGFSKWSEAWAAEAERQERMRKQAELTGSGTFVFSRGVEEAIRRSQEALEAERTQCTSP
jgi:hypothetical protein